MKYFLVIIFLLVNLSISVFATPTVNIETTYYIIKGSTANELRKEMNSKSTIMQDGELIDAFTSWDVSWQLNWNPKNDKCHITTVSSNLDVTFTLPKWTSRDKADKNTIKQWDRYYKALIQHESGHRDIAVQAAENIEKEILGLGPSSSCKELEKKANQTGKITLNKYIALEKEYDKKTNHGMQDGAIFP
jgi:predicted secreted Zn-dependent protease